MRKFSNYTNIIKHSFSSLPPEPWQLSIGELALQVNQDTASLYTLTIGGEVVPVGTGYTRISQLEDVESSNPDNNSQLVFDRARQKYVATTILGSLSNLNDVVFETRIQSGDVMVYNSIYEEWTNAPPTTLLSTSPDISIPFKARVSNTSIPIFHRVRDGRTLQIGELYDNENFAIVNDRLYKWTVLDIADFKVLGWSNLSNSWEGLTPNLRLFDMIDVLLPFEMDSYANATLEQLLLKKDHLLVFSDAQKKWIESELQIFWDKSPTLGGNLDAAGNQINNLSIASQNLTPIAILEISLSQSNYFVITGVTSASLPVCTIVFSQSLVRANTTQVFFIELRQSTGLFAFSANNLRYENGIRPQLSGPGKTDIVSVLATNITRRVGNQDVSNTFFTLSLRTINLGAEGTVSPTIPREWDSTVDACPATDVYREYDLLFDQVEFLYDFDTATVRGLVKTEVQDKSVISKQDLTFTGTVSFLNGYIVLASSTLVDLGLADIQDAAFTYDLQLKFNSWYEYDGILLQTNNVLIEIFEGELTVEVLDGSWKFNVNSALSGYCWCHVAITCVPISASTRGCYLQINGNRIYPFEVLNTTTLTIAAWTYARILNIEANVDSIRLSKIRRYDYVNFLPPFRTAPRIQQPASLGQDILEAQIFGIYNLDSEQEVMA